MSTPSPASTRSTRSATGAIPLRPVRHHLGITAFGINSWTAKTREIASSTSTTRPTTGARSSTSWCRGAPCSSSTERQRRPAGTFVFVPPGVMRTAFAEEPGTTILAVGGIPGRHTSRTAGRSGPAYRRSTRRRNTPPWPTAGRELVEANPPVPGALLQPRLLREPRGPDGRCDRATSGRRPKAVRRFREYAKDDSDFDPIRDEPAFKELVGV